MSYTTHNTFTNGAVQLLKSLLFEQTGEKFGMEGPWEWVAQRITNST
jgi:hypothetical protein